MAKIFYLLKQNNIKNSKIFGKWFAHGKTIETLNTRKLANHIAEHGSTFTFSPVAQHSNIATSAILHYFITKWLFGFNYIIYYNI